MEMMPSVERFSDLSADVGPMLAIAGGMAVTTSDWRQKLPVLHGRGVTMRELRLRDAASLYALLTTEEVAKFISPPPTSVQGFEKFITWCQNRRARGEHVCFGIVPEGYDVAVGMIQIQMPSDELPEWGFALGSPFWGSGHFMNGAEAVLDFAFSEVGVDQLGARAAVLNGRGNGALRKLGAYCEGIVPHGLLRNGRYLDQYYWSIYADIRLRGRVVWDLGAGKHITPA